MNDEIRAALEKLAHAHGADALLSTLRQVQGEVRRARRDASRKHGALSTAVNEAWKIRDAMKADGVTGDALDAGMEGVVRQLWPQQRVWHYQCERCHDTGLRMFVCQKGARCNGISTRIDSKHDEPGKYLRLCAKFPNSDYAHDYGEPCLCVRGARFTRAPKPPSDDLNDAGKKPTGFGRFGR